MSRPKILITLDTSRALRRGVPFPSLQLKQAYVRAVECAGGLPLLVAPTEDPEVLSALVPLMDGLVVTGGDFDIPPSAYGESSQDMRLDDAKPQRTHFETLLLEAALQRGRPVLGICGGMQLLNVVLGGTLLQDIQTVLPQALDHEQATSPATPDHPLLLEPGGCLEAMLGPGPHAANTTHHQSVGRLGAGLQLEAKAPDGVIEAISKGPSVIGVQWHPELLFDEVSRRLYANLIQRACA